jgi:hypothetical protein
VAPRQEPRLQPRRRQRLPPDLRGVRWHTQYIVLTSAPGGVSENAVQAE